MSSLTHSTPYPDINAVLRLLLTNVQQVLGDQLVGMYLHGSLASGDFEPLTSDVDFVVVTAERLPEATVAELEVMHARLLASGMDWANKLEGTYFPRRDLRRYRSSDALYPSLNEAKFYMGGHGSDWVIGSYILREHGLTLAGPPPQSLIDPVAPEELRQATRELLREWWAPMLEDTARLRGSDYQAYATLTMCRALYTLEHGAVVSKPAAAGWAREVLGGRRAALIERALAWRPGMQLDALDELLGLIRYTLDRSSGLSV
ncbi:MAG TPA: aminoglycoside adenylyltransferase domain-containing protein [Roseiflexaceae bacterium]|nr:aminoglycoside adenylyltransferase domain-containing protein [Roseiflexaceae bacterium]